MKNSAYFTIGKSSGVKARCVVRILIKPETNAIFRYHVLLLAGRRERPPLMRRDESAPHLSARRGARLQQKKPWRRPRTPRALGTGIDGRPFLRPGLAEILFFEIGDAALHLDVLHVAELSFDRIDLRVEGDDMILGCHVTFDIGNVFRHGKKTLFHLRLDRGKS